MDWINTKPSKSKLTKQKPKLGETQFIKQKFPPYFTSHSKPERLRSYMASEKNLKRMDDVSVNSLLLLGKPKQISKRNLSWPQAKRRFPLLSPMKDADKDGVINLLDCRPFNKKKQGWGHEERKEGGYRIKLMSPKVYLKKTKTNPFANKHDRMIMSKFGDHDKTIMTDYGRKHKMRDIKHLSKYIKDKKTKVSVPYVGDDPTDHEGRHRAYAAHLAGQKLIPVTIANPPEMRTKEFAKKFVNKVMEDRDHIMESDYAKWEDRFEKAFPQRLMGTEYKEKYKELLKEEGIDLDKEYEEVESKLKDQDEGIELPDYDLEDEDDITLDLPGEEDEE